MKYRVVKSFPGSNMCDIQEKGLLWGWNLIAVCFSEEEAKRWLDNLEMLLYSRSHPNVILERDIPEVYE